MKLNVKTIAAQAMIAAVYTGLTLLLAPVGFGPWQMRAAEALTLLPFINPMCIIGVTVGCALSNIIGSGNVLDMIFGPLATLLAAFLTSRAKNVWIAAIPPVVINALVIGAVLAYALEGAFGALFPLFALQIGAGQAVACFGLGIPLVGLMKRYTAVAQDGGFVWKKTK